MYLVNGITGVAFTVYEGNLNMGVIDQQSEQFPTGIPGATYYACFYLCTHRIPLIVNGAFPRPPPVEGEKSASLNSLTCGYFNLLTCLLYHLINSITFINLLTGQLINSSTSLFLSSRL
jgi:hypothetical protein